MSDSWQFRHPVGPDAIPMIAWRKGMTDEQWVDLILRTTRHFSGSWARHRPQDQSGTRPSGHRRLFDDSLLTRHNGVQVTPAERVE